MSSKQGNAMTRNRRDVLISTISIDILMLKCMQLATWNVQFPNRPFWRLYANFDAGAAVEFEGERIELCPNELVLIAPHTTFRAILERPVRHFYIHFTLGPPHDEMGPLLVTRTMPPDMGDTVHTMAETGRYRPQMLGSILAVIGFGLSQIKPDRWYIAPQDERIRHVQNAMSSRLEHPWTNDELAEHANYSTNALIRRFKQVTGVSPQRWLRQQRINQARILLEHSGMSIDEIAAECGFSDRSHFSRSFSGVVGTGPASYRRDVATYLSGARE